jgi:hypothetical protein
MGLSYRPAGLHSLAEMVPWNRFLGFLKVEKKLGIPFRTILRKKKQLEITFWATTINAKSRNSVPKHFADENTLLTLFGGADFFVKLISFV